MRATRLAVLLSGRGSNFAAIARASASGWIPIPIVAVISNRPDAAGLVHARDLGLPAHLVDHGKFPSREEHEAELAKLVSQAGADLIALAGYMRLLSPWFIERFRNRIVNIHPSLLPSFPGLDAQAQALAHGVRVSGCTVHLVDEQLDGGPILVQRAVEVMADDSVESLSSRILVEEHLAYPDAIRKLSGGYHVDQRRVIFKRNG
jgi:phosphoribosylglycinamide formyltransferase 1